MQLPATERHQWRQANRDFAARFAREASAQLRKQGYRWDAPETAEETTTEVARRLTAERLDPLPRRRARDAPIDPATWVAVHRVGLGLRRFRGPAEDLLSACVEEVARAVGEAEDSEAWRQRVARLLEKTARWREIDEIRKSMGSREIPTDIENVQDVPGSEDPAQQVEDATRTVNEVLAAARESLAGRKEWEAVSAREQLLRMREEVETTFPPRRLRRTLRMAWDRDRPRGSCPANAHCATFEAAEARVRAEMEHAVRAQLVEGTQPLRDGWEA
jgi:hypothetical protein